MQVFEGVEQSHLSTQWLWQCDNKKPHRAIEGIPPNRLLQILSKILLIRVPRAREITTHANQKFYPLNSLLF